MYGRWANFDKKAISKSFGVPGTLVFAKNGDDTFETERDWKEFSPHVGIAYQIGSRAVLRAGYGLFYSPIGMNYWFGVPYGFAPGYRGTNRVTPTADLSPAFNWDAGYPGTFVPGTKDPDYTQWGMVNVSPKSLFAGYSHQWNVGTQFTLTNDFRLDVTYMQNEGRRLQSGDFERNQPEPGAMANLIRSGHVWDAVYDASSAASVGADEENHSADRAAHVPNVERLPESDGAYSWRFPTVVAPRYMPGSPVGHSGDGVVPDTTSVPPPRSGATIPSRPEHTSRGARRESLPDPRRGDLPDRQGD